MTSLTDVADELYGLPLEEFTAARNARERQVREAGDRDLARAIHQFAKPKLVAWLTNQLVREYPEEISQLVELGAALREATTNLAGDELRLLSRRQHEVVAALTHRAEQVAGAAGRQMGEDTARALSETFHAALADPAAADALVAGRLAEGLRASSFSSPDGPGGGRPATAAKPRAGRTSPSSTAKPKGASRRRSAARAVAEAEALVKEAAQHRSQADRTVKQAEERVLDAEARVERLRRELEEARQARSEAEQSRRQARSEAAQADRQHRDAERRLATAAERDSE